MFNLYGSARKKWDAEKIETKKKGAAKINMGKKVRKNLTEEKRNFKKCINLRKKSNAQQILRIPYVKQIIFF